ncbi:ferredoxin [Amycolatopsis sp. NBRC 101858]|uniref:PDR/VanB family oxidoreductase n=1 Tax=Amycolatopsis sp. NBRC 101858 TaxID=3032200 RepID=UPI0024A11D97|nr:PDR/VanB family oxidoreductase [Amycolatopsis sp. NBRC 101858]GLY38874.1 ferredoxin [Amycolatopsis sp. NBRC 101858]
MSRNPVKLRVRAAERVADQVVAVTLESMAGLDLVPWEPGAHVEVVLPSGLVRHYSLCGNPADRATYRIAVLREEAGRGGSSELHEVAEPGAVLEVRPPRNAFALEAAAGYLFLVGGIGVTPILPMLGAAERAGLPWRLVYGGRTRSHMAFVDELVAAHGDRVRIAADDVEGRPDLVAEIGGLPPDRLVYACGPAPMLDLVTEVAAAAGAADRLRLERFAVAAADTHGEEFEVELARSGRTLTVGPSETILAVLRENGVSTPFSCENGYCGTCEAVVLDGEPDHRDTYLTADEKDEGFTTMVCVSRCRGPRLVLDL